MEVAEIIEAVDVTEYISQYVEFEEKGGELWAISPFNPTEKTPSFSLRPETKLFYDFSAGFGGNIIDFITKLDGISVRAAVQKLKAFAHITETEDGPVTRLEASRIAKKYRLQAKQQPQMTAKPLPERYMERYEFRRDKLQLWADEGISWDTMRRYGVRYDAVDDRIVYPVRDYDGRIFCVSGRTCDPDFKAKGLRKYTYMGSIGTLNTIYGYAENMPAIITSKEIIIFEGAKSVMLAHGWGFENCGALLTSHLSQNQFEYLLRLSNFHGVQITFALDADVDITKDARIMKLTQYTRVFWVRNRQKLLEDKMAPVDAGKEVWERLYQMKEPLNERTMNNEDYRLREEGKRR